MLYTVRSQVFVVWSDKSVKNKFQIKHGEPLDPQFLYLVNNVEKKISQKPSSVELSLQRKSKYSCNANNNNYNSDVTVMTSPLDDNSVTLEEPSLSLEDAFVSPETSLLHQVSLLTARKDDVNLEQDNKKLEEEFMVAGQRISELEEELALSVDINSPVQVNAAKLKRTILEHQSRIEELTSETLYANEKLRKLEEYLSSQKKTFEEELRREKFKNQTEIQQYRDDITRYIDTTKKLEVQIGKLKESACESDCQWKEKYELLERKRHPDDGYKARYRALSRDHESTKLEYDHQIETLNKKLNNLKKINKELLHEIDLVPKRLEDDEEEEEDEEELAESSGEEFEDDELSEESM